MPRVIDTHFSLNGGIISPRVQQRVDVDVYQKSADELENVVVLPQGGVTRRAGLEFIDNPVLPADLGKGIRLIPFAVSDEVSYMLLFMIPAASTLGRMYVYKDGVLITNINSSGFDYLTLTTTWTATDFLKDMNFSQSADTLYIFHESRTPYSIVRNGADNLWTGTNTLLSNLPQVDFNDSFSPTPVNAVRDLTFTNMSLGDTYRIELPAGTQSSLISWDTSFGATNASRIESAIRNMPGQFGDPSDINVVDQGGNVYRVTWGPSATKFWDRVLFIQGSTANAAANMTHAFIVNGTQRTENAFKSIRGYPRCGVFHQGRMWVGGSTFLPNSLMATQVNGFSQTTFDFDIGEGFPDQAIFVTLDTDRINVITQLVSSRHLQIFTTGGEFYIPASPITPETITIPNQTRFGTANIAPISIDGATLYAQKSGSTIRNFIFTDLETAYGSDSVSLLAEDLIVNPLRMASQTGREGEDATYLYVVMSDGTVGVLNTLRQQNVAGWTKFTTDGEFIDVAVDVDEPYFIIKRTVNSVEQHYLERLTDGCFTDSCNTVTTGASPVTVAAGLVPHLDQKSVRVRVDGAQHSEQVVGSSGDVTLDVDSPNSLVEAGLSFPVRVKMLPVGVQMQAGNTLYRKQRISRVKIQLYQSLAVKVQGNLLPSHIMDASQFDTAPVPRDTLEDVRLLGWHYKPQLLITQDDPFPMTVLAVEMETQVSI